MRKIIQPCICEVPGCGSVKKAKAYAKIEFSGGRLSITGVVGPLCDGNCRGSSGQCIDEIREGKPSKGWDDEMLQKFCDIWDAWHLNDMRPYCQHQKKLGWDKLAGKRVKLYHYSLTLDAIRKKGETCIPTDEQIFYASLPYRVVKPTEWHNENYEPHKPLYSGDYGPTETKTLGWLRPTEHPEGILGKACPVCGYKYGTAWLKEAVPQDVIDWLFNLPNSTSEPAWI